MYTERGVAATDGLLQIIRQGVQQHSDLPTDSVTVAAALTKTGLLTKEKENTMQGGSYLQGRRQQPTITEN
ncbi:unnamed protein product [Mesocestoides corti]|uniref:HARE-HTH domain-containing protein n=1 Tax=Mesocestoides corti TaxID=53468 RepID=A0A0R3UEQ8_MESCO|nr:unnamed protein product [Mesocestoides corti]